MSLFHLNRFERSLLSSVRLFFGVLVFATANAQPPRPTPTPIDGALGTTITAARRADRRVTVEGLSEPLEKLKVVGLDGRDISSRVQARTEGGKVTIGLSQLTPVVLKPNAIDTLAIPANGRLTLPGGAVVPLVAQADRGAPDKAVWFRLTFAASPVPAPWDEKQDGYVTNLTFGLKRPDDAPPGLTLNEPVIVKLSYQGLNASEVPAITINGAGLENEKTVSLRFNPLTAKPVLLVRSSISDVNLELTALPRLDLQPTRSDIIGLGLDEVGITVTNVEADGKSLPVSQATMVVVEVEGRGRIDDTPLQIKKGEASTSFVIHSSGFGAVVIHASADGVAGATVVKQHFPVSPVIATLLGGALGGFARRFVKGARRKAIGLRIVEGLVVATVAFVAGVLGVGYLNLPAAIVATEAGAFLTGALTGFVGVTVFEAIGKKAGSA